MRVLLPAGSNPVAMAEQALVAMTVFGNRLSGVVASPRRRVAHLEQLNFYIVRSGDESRFRVGLPDLDARFAHLVERRGKVVDAEANVIDNVARGGFETLARRP